MPITPTYPGVYIEELPSGVRTITGVATSITAFIGRASKGPTNKPIRIQNFGDFERQFGELWVESAMSYAVQQYFLNGGTDAIIVRVVGKNASKAMFDVGGLKLIAASEGDWSNGLIAVIDHKTRPLEPGEQPLFNLTIKKVIREEAAANGRPEVFQTQPLEVFRNVSVDSNAPRFITKVLEQESSLVRIRETEEDTGLPAGQPEATSESRTSPRFAGGTNGEVPTYADYKGSLSAQTGLYALEQADLFNLLCIPPNKRGTSVVDDPNQGGLLEAALKYCKDRRAMLIIDPPTKWDDMFKSGNASQTVDSDIGSLRDENAAIYFPQLIMPDPLKENRLEEFPPCGAVAGIFARTDAQRGVWKAPAGIEATLSGVRQLSYKMTDGENGQLNPLGINCLRSFPVYGNVVWGARTLEGADQLASEWKYVPVRRLVLFLEESLYRGTQWVVFEPNDEPLWGQIRLNIGAFMNNLFRQGAFQGKSPKEAYFVKCDSETTTQNDINLGIVNIVVGFAPLKPAEFVIIKFQQMAGQIAV
jgi:hypothetical protein